MIEYTQYKKLPEDYIKSKIDEFLKEDIPGIDVTTAGTVPADKATRAYIEAQQDFVFAGKEIIPAFFDDKFIIRLYYNDGEEIKSGDRICDIEGPAGRILSVERVILNLLQRLCAIATKAKELSKHTNPHGVRLLDTRKTTPGIRLFEKYAVTCGGGFNHRMDLSSGVLIKDNHIRAAGGVKAALKKVREKAKRLPIEIEVDNFRQIKEALDAGVDGFLLDNFSPDDTIKAVKMIRDYPGGVDIFIESSGGINLTNISDYVSAGINAISTGSVTHSVSSVDMHMEFEDI
ncbi:MAG: carboxylating nicotinate-nucleotide diphosphorylase [Candidatus Kapaibacterium sp.]